jgi:hypothetical protein
MSPAPIIPITLGMFLAIQFGPLVVVGAGIVGMVAGAGVSGMVVGAGVVESWSGIPGVGSGEVRLVEARVETITNKFEGRIVFPTKRETFFR